VGAVYVVDRGDSVITRRDVVLSRRAERWFELDPAVK
jgi:hypothetical protein